MILSTLEKLKLFQYKNKMTIARLASELGVSREYLSRVLMGKRPLTDQLTNRMEILFRQYGAVEFLDKELRL